MAYLNLRGPSTFPVQVRAAEEPKATGLRLCTPVHIIAKWHGQGTKAVLRMAVSKRSIHVSPWQGSSYRCSPCWAWLTGNRGFFSSDNVSAFSGHAGLSSSDSACFWPQLLLHKCRKHPRTLLPALPADALASTGLAMVLRPVSEGCMLVLAECGKMRVIARWGMGTSTHPVRV